MARPQDIPRPDPWLGRLLPSRIRRDIFDPAARDLRNEVLRSRAARRWLAARLLLLYVDCWRVAWLPADPIARARLQTLRRAFSLKGKGSHMWQDIRFALRRLARERAFTAAAVLTLTLGVGANVAVFAVVEAVLLRPLPYVDADRLVILKHRDERTGITKEFIAIGDFVDLAARQTAFENLAAYTYGRATIYGVGEPTVVPTLTAGPGLLDTFRLQAETGRLIESNDTRQGASPVAVISRSLWERMFKSDPGVVGRRIRIGATDREIVGVAPAGFGFPVNEHTDVILPLAMPSETPADRKSVWVFALGRLGAQTHEGGHDADGANAQLSTLSQQLEREHPQQNQGSRYYTETLRDQMAGETKRPLTLLAFAVGAVLLIACANVGNLFLVRALGQQQEMAVRAALGASRERLAAHVLVESLVLAIVSAGGGVAMAHWGTPALVSLVPESVDAPGLADVGLNLKVLGFALGIAIIAALVFGLMSALVASTPAAALASPGRAGVSRRVRRLTSVVVVAEIGLAVVLLLGAGLILRSFAGLMSVDPGFRLENVATFDMTLPSARYSSPSARAAFYQRARAAAQAVPGVETVGFGVVTPLTGNNWTTPFNRLDRPVPAGERPPDVGWQSASGSFFRVLGIPLRSGRLFDERDGPGGAPVVIVSEEIERRFFDPGESAVGHVVKQGDTQAEIVGVVGDIRRAALTDEPRADMYFPFERQPGTGITVFAKTTEDAAAAVPGLRAAFRSIEPDVVILNAGTLAHTAAQSVGTTRLTLWLLGLFAVIALALAGVGIYGVLSHAVRQRTREIGTRLALGASPRNILWLVMRWGAGLAAAGVTLGGAVGLVAVRSLESLLFGVRASDPRVLVASTTVLVVTALAASAFPARRASKTDPARALSV